MKIIIGILLILEILSAEYIRDDSSQVVKDTSNNLVWQDDSDAKTIKKEWKNAIEHCKGLGNDWRLPTFNELYSIIDQSKKSPAIKSAFKNVATDDYYWTSTTYADDTAYAWVVYFYYGGDYWYGKSDSLYVRCVRGQSFDDLKKSSDIVPKGRGEDFLLYLRRNANDSLNDLQMKYYELREWIANRKRLALVMGINNYTPERNGFDPLPTSKKDAQDMYKYLKEDLQYDEAILLVDEQVTRDAIYNAIDRLNRSGNSDGNNDIVVYFSGHGEQFNGSTRIVTYDGKSQSATLPKMLDLVDNVSHTHFKHRLFIFDSCYSGNIDNVSSDIVFMSPNKEKELQRRVTVAKENIATAMYRNGTHILTSTSQDQVARTSPTRWGGNSLFTYYLLKGVRDKEADNTHTPDGVITLPELWKYLRENIRSAEQKPALKDYPFNTTWQGELMFYKKEE